MKFFSIFFYCALQFFYFLCWRFRYCKIGMFYLQLWRWWSWSWRFYFRWSNNFMSNILPFSRSSELDVFLIIGWKSLENWWHSIIFQSSTLCSWPDDKVTFMKVVTTNEAMFCWLPLFSANCMNPLFQQVCILMWKAMERIFWPFLYCIVTTNCHTVIWHIDWGFQLWTPNISALNWDKSLLFFF